MRIIPLVGAGVVVAAGVRLARSRLQGASRPFDRQMAADLQVWGCAEPVGDGLIDRPGRHAVTVRLSRGLGARRDRADVRGLAIRVPGAGRDTDLLVATVGSSRFGYRLPVQGGTGGERPRLVAGLDPAASGELLLYAVSDGSVRPFGRLVPGSELYRATDSGRAFDPLYDAPERLHGIRALASRAGRRWRGVIPALESPAATARTTASH